MSTNKSRSGTALRTVLGAGLAATLLAAALPGAGLAHFVYTKQAAPDTQEFFPADQLPAGVTGFVIAWSLAALENAQGTVYGEEGSGYQMAVRVKCVGFPSTQYDDALAVKTSPPGILQSVSYVRCPSGVDIEWAQGQFVD